MSYDLVTEDNTKVPISADALQHSLMLRQLIEDTDLTMDTPIPVGGGVNAETLRKVVEWCEHHKNDPKPEPERQLSSPCPSPPPFDMPKWDRQFLHHTAVSIPHMANLIRAANYLEVPWLYKYCCKRIYMDYIKDKTVDQLKAMFEPREEDLKMEGN